MGGWRSGVGEQSGRVRARAGAAQPRPGVSRGRGEVRQVDAGTYQTVARDDQGWVVRMTGTLMVGDVTLQQLSEDEWQLVWPSEHGVT